MKWKIGRNGIKMIWNGFTLIDIKIGERIENFELFVMVKENLNNSILVTINHNLIYLVREFIVLSITVFSHLLYIYNPLSHHLPLPPPSKPHPYFPSLYTMSFIIFPQSHPKFPLYMCFLSLWQSIS